MKDVVVTIDVTPDGHGDAVMYEQNCLCCVMFE
jgi:hypothetical protein